MNVLECHNARQRAAILAIIEMRRSLPKFTLNDIYMHLDAKRTDLNDWTRDAFGVTVAKYVDSVLKGNPIQPLKHFKVKHYVELTELGRKQILQAISKGMHVTLGLNDITEICYGAINEEDMLCVEIAAATDGPYCNSRLMYTNFAMRDPALFRIVPYTTPGVMLGIQNRNLGLEF